MIEYGMPAEEYHAIPALSYSGMCDLAVSPLRYWHLWVNPSRPKDEPTKFMEFGSALHCAILEPAAFDSRYVCALDPSEFESCLETIGEMRAWLESRGKKPSGTRKDEMIRQVQAVDPAWPILDVLKAEYAAQHEGKTEFKKDDWFRLGGAAQALRQEPQFAELLQSGHSEVTFLATHPGTGIKLKCRTDWASETHTVDVKSFTVTRGKSVDQAVNDAIYYERYHWQARFYALVRSLADGNKSRSGAQHAPEHVLAFVESEKPHEVRLRSLRPVEAGSVNMLWERARFETDTLIRLYAECWERYGEKPWRTSRDVEPLINEEFPQLAFS